MSKFKTKNCVWRQSNSGFQFCNLRVNRSSISVN